jgi:hypothetical protein
MLHSFTRIVLLSFLTLSVAACQKEKKVAKVADGVENGPCYGNQTCNEGLACENNSCVKKKEPIELLAALVDEMCACRDKACADAVQAKGEAAMPDEVVEALMREKSEEVEALGNKMLACATKMEGAQDFDTYIKKSKSAEGLQFIKKMSDAARMYYTEPTFATADPRVAEVIKKRFPRSVGPTPPLGSCCQGVEGRCPVDMSQWEQAGWKELDFALHDPHYYSYEFKQDETSYEAIAYGDLDCDGKYSTFTLRGKVVDGEVEAALEIEEKDPLE